MVHAQIVGVNYQQARRGRIAQPFLHGCFLDGRCSERSFRGLGSRTRLGEASCTQATKNKLYKSADLSS